MATDRITAPGSTPPVAIPTTAGGVPSQVSPPEPAVPSIPSAQTEFLYRLSVEQYESMVRSGILREGRGVELIDGLLVRKMPKGDRHYLAALKISHLFSRGLPEGWLAAAEAPLILEASEPEPDLMVVRGRIDDPGFRRPRPDSVGLFVEIADSTYAADRERIPIFAEAGIPTYWIVHIPAGRIEVYSEPTGPDPSPTYRRRDDYARGTRVPVVLDGAVAFELTVAELLPPL